MPTDMQKEFLDDPSDMGPLARYNSMPGIDEIGGLPNPPPQVLVVTTAPVELNAVRRRLQAPNGSEKVGKLSINKVPLLVGQLGGRLVIVCKTEQGTSNTETTILRLLESKQLSSAIRLVFAIGFCFGVNPAKASDTSAEDGQLIGDVLVANRVIDLSHTAEKTRTEFRTGSSVNESLMSVLNDINTLGWPKANDYEDWLKIKDRPRPPKAAVGALISAPILFNNREELEGVLKHDQVKPYKPLGGDMELFQIAKAVQAKQKMWLLAKSVGDYGGIKPKHDKGQNLANATAVDFADWFLRLGSIDQVLDTAPEIPTISREDIHRRLAHLGNQSYTSTKKDVKHRGIHKTGRETDIKDGRTAAAVDVNSIEPDAKGAVVRISLSASHKFYRKTFKGILSEYTDESKSVDYSCAMIVYLPREGRSQLRGNPVFTVTTGPPKDHDAAQLGFRAFEEKVLGPFLNLDFRK